MLSRDPHVVRLIDVKHGLNKEEKTVLYLVFEYMETDLKKFIRSFRQTTRKVPLDIVKTLMFQLFKGVAFCHGHGILHRDLKPHNLLMEQKTLMLKIADLGLARAFTVEITSHFCLSLHLALASSGVSDLLRWCSFSFWVNSVLLLLLSPAKQRIEEGSLSKIENRRTRQWLLYFLFVFVYAMRGL
ncbi:cyclin-dependent kinase B2-1-like [Humulus lupulus]|uniref:cyclin-dependent kinase B2-1-like n=1 Tax=Humulus lupulus TaxID=3486 RepID=UPI002B409FB1|nr:cyclin-dependent kinase B2-1-like [Humulus lupulus]